MLSQLRPHSAQIIIGTVCAVLAASMTVGADTMWLVALGDSIRETGHIPLGVPYAFAPTEGWPNVPVLGELAFSYLHLVGIWGLAAAQLIAVSVTLILLAFQAAREGASAPAIAVAILLVTIASLPSFGIIRAQTMSLIPFALLVVLLRSEALAPSAGIWLCVPLIAIWGNLHGAVLVGLAITLAYLAFCRLREAPITSVAVGLTATLSLFLNPALVATPTYYLGVLQNEAAKRGSQLWSSPSLTSLSDILMILSIAVLTVSAGRQTRRVWEYVVIGGLCLGTIMARRNAIWMALFLLVPAATAATEAWRASKSSHGPSERARATSSAIILTFTACTMFILSNHQARLESVEQAAKKIASLTQDCAVLAPDRLAESLAAAGARLWVANPIDAFSRADQSAYLDFLDGSGPGLPYALSSAEVVVTSNSRSVEAAQSLGYYSVAQVDEFLVMARPTARHCASDPSP